MRSLIKNRQRKSNKRNYRKRKKARSYKKRKYSKRRNMRGGNYDVILADIFNTNTLPDETPLTYYNLQNYKGDFDDLNRYLVRYLKTGTCINIQNIDLAVSVLKNCDNITEILKFVEQSC